MMSVSWYPGMDQVDPAVVAFVVLPVQYIETAGGVYLFHHYDVGGVRITVRQYIRGANA